uniref:Uncharacterized protein n=1 Tax=Ralstonia solanacearum TaxID=305 RepID=A0A0S4UFT6_RALSL|nr:protein of unknown function [Ralstonia solanacearum]
MMCSGCCRRTERLPARVAGNTGDTALADVRGSYVGSLSAAEKKRASDRNAQKCASVAGYGPSQYDGSQYVDTGIVRHARHVMN